MAELVYALVLETSAARLKSCLLYTSDAADDTPCVDLGGRRIIKKMGKWRNWYTRWSEKPVPQGLRVRVSSCPPKL